MSKVSARDALHRVVDWLVGISFSFGSEFFLDALGLLTCFVLTDFLLLFEDSLVRRVHLKVGFKLRHLDRLAVAKGYDVVE